MSIDSRRHQYGTVFEHWRIQNKLGQGSGGKSAVYLLTHADTESFQSALKVVSLIEEYGNPNDLSPQRLAEYRQSCDEYSHRAQQEVLLMNDLQGNSHIVDYLDHTFVDWSNNEGFGRDMLIRMEKLEDLRSKLRAGRQYTREEIIQVGIHICEALSLCHSKGILHRDIKPGNIFVNKDGNYKLGDFGISRILDSSASYMASTGIGTPQYWAPEQISGTYDNRVDIYSLGLVLYEMANDNRLPFATGSYIRESEIQRRMMGERLPAPVNADEDLASVILQACAYDPDHRFSTATAFRNALKGLLTDATQSAKGGKVGTYTGGPVVGTTGNGGNVGTTGGNMGTNIGNSGQNGTTQTNKKKWLIPLLAILAALLVLGILLFIRNYDGRVDFGGEEKADTAHRNDRDKDDEDDPEDRKEDEGGNNWNNWNDREEEKPESPEEVPPKEVPSEEVPSEEVPIQTIPPETEAPTLSPREITAQIMEPTAYIAAGGLQSIVILPDGRAISTGDNAYGACNVGSWQDLIAVSSGDYFTVGLKKDGTLVATGDNQYGQCNVSGWQNIVAIAAGDFHTIGLRQDGTVVAVGDNRYGQCDVSVLNCGKEIVAVAASWDHTAVLYADGTAAAIGNNSNGECNVSGWRDVVAIYAGANFTVGLKADGTVVATGSNDYGQCNVGAWRNVTMISAGDYHTVAITADGQVYATGRNDYGQCNVTGWRNIIALGAGCYHTVAISADGTILATGRNSNGQCDVSRYNWK